MSYRYGDSPDPLMPLRRVKKEVAGWCHGCQLTKTECECVPKEEPKQVQAPYYCPAPRHGWMQKPCACLEAIKDPGTAGRGFEQVQAPDEIWLLAKGGVYCPHWFRSEDHALDSEYYCEGAVAVRYVKAGGQ